MKTRKYGTLILTFLLLVGFISTTTLAKLNQQISDTSNTEKDYFAIEISGVLCGYMETSESAMVKDERTLLKQDMNMFIMLSLLGSEFNTEMKANSLLDPETRRTYYTKVDIKQGTINRNFEIKTESKIAVITSSLNSQPKIIELTPDVLIGSDEVFTNVKKDIWVNGKTEVSYNILEAMEEQIQNSTFKRIRDEKIELAGKTFNTIVIEQKNNKSGLTITYWLTPEYDYFIKFEVMNRKIYLADHTVVDKIKVANMNESIFTKTNVQISDIQAIRYLKLKAEIQPSGVNLKPEDLNIPGQKFTGTVVDDLVDGVFEIAAIKYNGENAPLFPTNFKNDEAFKKYLEAERNIECDDPILIEKANEIIKGSKDSWEAVTKLSKWVAENIHYAIPGGGTARKTFDIRVGECGAHSFLLTAFCRAVGIPARVVWGAMYAPNYGGGFGQHGWNEIYMGTNGWIQVDATANESDYVDAGHIRIAELQSVATSFNGKKFEVLDYKLAGKEVEKTAENYSKYFGKYTNLETSKTFTVLEKEGNLSVDITGQMVLPFNEPDQKGRWYCKLSPSLFIEFKKDENNLIDKFIIHEMVGMTKKSSPEKIDVDVPENLKPYLGSYLFAAVNLEFKVYCKDGMLAIDDPIEKGTFKLQPPNEEGGWFDEYNKNVVYFEKDSEGKVINLKIDVANAFTKGELVSDSLEKLIRAEGIESAMQKYHLLRMESNPNLIFSERSINALGYKFLNEGKFNEAIEIFEMNVADYPESFNVYDSLGEAYMKSGEKALAIENYQKSLGLNPQNENAKKRLEELKTK